jgi:hypothetical protein
VEDHKKLEFAQVAQEGPVAVGVHTYDRTPSNEEQGAGVPQVLGLYMVR